jgi:hypothetical protein
MDAVIPAPSRPAVRLPPVLLGSLTPEIRIRVESFYSSVYEIFERWVNRPRSLHTQRSYQEGVLSFVWYRGMVWPQEASSLLMVSVAELQDYRDALETRATGGLRPIPSSDRVFGIMRIPEIYQFHALLGGVSPLIWRRLLIRSDQTIADLHYALQISL